MPKDILVIMTDQHRADWVGAFGGRHVRTPNLDALASEGAIFTRAYTTCPVCMPARASFLTGQYPHNFGMWDNIGRVRDVSDTYLHPLRRAGYRTAHVGKSHLYSHGGGKDLRDELPYMHALGWDDVLECTGPLSTQTTKSMLTDWMEENGIYDLFLRDYRERCRLGNKALWPSPLPDGMHMDDFIGDTAVKYIENSDRTSPLYLFVGIGGPHNPWDSPKRFDTYDPADMPPPLPDDPAPEWLTGPALEHHKRMMGKNRDITPEEWARIRALYSGKVENVDYQIGKVLEAWWAARGRDTWVLFWTDHGEMAGDKGRCSKSVFYEASAHVPIILRPPGGVATPVSCDGLVSLTDLTATILDMAGCEPYSPNVFGRSLLPAFEDPSAVGSPLVVSEIHDRTMIFDGRWKMVVNSQNEVLKLFDLVEDPSEALNLAGRSDTLETVTRLREELLNFLLRTADKQFGEVNG